VQNQATGQQTLVLYQTPAQQIFQPGIAKILNNKFWSLALRSQMSKHDVYNPGFEGLDMTPSTCHIPTLNSFNFIRL